MEKTFKVSSYSKVKALSVAIVKSLAEDYDVRLDAIGAGAVNQAVKAVAAAKQMTDISFLSDIDFFDVSINGEQKSGIKITIKKLHP
ncbi:MAG: stage V sporulation protein S [Oscillospiraceae bacterium]|nr:stage V sporulation protein S [Oscillospiraceae bacterium]